MINWKQQKELAEAMGISPSFVNDIMNRRRQCPVKRAHAMAAAYYRLFGEHVEPHVFILNKTSSSPVLKPLTHAQLAVNLEEAYGNTKPRSSEQPA